MQQNNANYYAADLAYVHDAGHGTTARHAAGYIADSLNKRGIRTGTIVDLGCGSGIMAARLSEQYEVIGVDYSPSMIELARQNAPGATFHTGSYLDFPLPDCVAVTSVGECLNYLFDPAHSYRQLEQLFARVHRALLPGGLFVFDVVEPGLLGPEPVQKRVVEHDEWTMFLDYSENRTTGVLERNIILFRKTGDCYRKSTEVHTLQLYNREKVRRLLEETGFTVAIHEQYNDLVLRKHNIAFTAVKP